MAAFRICVGLISAMLVAGVATSAEAGKIACPVCGEVYEDNVDVCPNDGTDLKLTGIPVREDDRGGDDTPGDESGDTDTESAPPPSEQPSVIKYKRHDQGGERKPADRPESKGFSDRMSRIPKDPRHSAEHKPVPGTAEEKLKPEEEPFLEDVDKRIRSEFEQRRRLAFTRQKAIARKEAQAEKQRRLVHGKLLDRQGAPLASLGLRVLWMGEMNDPGPVGGGEIEVNLARYRLRAGISAMFGLRDLEVRNEAVFLGNLSIGIQAPKRFSPYIVAKGGVGMLKTERYRVDDVSLLTSLGFEVGVDAWVTPWVALTPSMGYVRCTMSDAYWHSFTAKLSIGF